jgi:hypothetical protein
VPSIPVNFHTLVPAPSSRESSAFKNFFLRSPSPQSMLSSQKRNPLLTLADMSKKNLSVPNLLS